MIVTSVIVLAIVGSAFAFNEKKLSVFCINIPRPPLPPDNVCNGFLNGKKIDPNFGISINYYANWDGASATCTGLNCATKVKVSNNP